MAYDSTRGRVMLFGGNDGIGNYWGDTWEFCGPPRGDMNCDGLDDGDAGNEVCYWGDHTFFPHMLNMLGKRKIRATIRFAPVPSPAKDRKQLAVQLREEVLKLKNHS